VTTAATLGEAPLATRGRRRRRHRGKRTRTWGRRFPDGSFRIAPQSGTRFEKVAGDELLFLGWSIAPGAVHLHRHGAREGARRLRIRGDLVAEGIDAPLRVGRRRGADPAAFREDEGGEPRNSSR